MLCGGGFGGVFCFCGFWVLQAWYFVLVWCCLCSLRVSSLLLGSCVWASLRLGLSCGFVPWIRYLVVFYLWI